MEELNKDIIDIKRLNPDIRDVTIGIKELRTIKIYPLSLRDQIKTADLVGNTLEIFFQAPDQSDAAFINLVSSLIIKNLEPVLKLIVDEKDWREDLLSEIWNNQAIEIASIVYEVNFKDLQKKVRGLFEKGKLLSERPSL